MATVITMMAITKKKKKINKLNYYTNEHDYINAK